LVLICYYIPFDVLLMVFPREKIQIFTGKEELTIREVVDLIIGGVSVAKALLFIIKL